MLVRIQSFAEGIGWTFVYFLYRITLPAYRLLDTLASNLDDLWLKCLEREERRVSIEQMAAAKGLTEDQVKKYLKDAKSITPWEFTESMLTAAGIVVMVFGFGSLAIIEIFNKYHLTLDLIRSAFWKG